jgi:hypothetical protein
MCTTGGVSGGSYTLPGSPALGDYYTDGSVVWKYLGQINIASGQQNFWVNYKPDMLSAYGADSHDSYASCLAWATACACVAIIAAGGSATAFLDTVIAGPSGKTVWGHLQDIMYFNVITQIDGTRHLTHVFQNNVNPKGGLYEAYFLEDNCEVYAGLDAMVYLAGLKSDAGYAAYATTSRDEILVGLRALYNQSVGAFKYEYGASIPAVAPTLFYPWVQSQQWPSQWGVPVPNEWKVAAIQYGNDLYDSWWKRSDIDDLRSYGAHYGLLVTSQDPSIRQEILDAYTAMRRSVTGVGALYSFDAAYLQAMRAYPDGKARALLFWK